jgi:hypothetical protein
MIEFRGRAPASPRPLLFARAVLLQKLQLGRRRCQHGDGRNARNFFRDAARAAQGRRNICAAATVFTGSRTFLPATERQDPMNQTEKARDKPAGTEHDRDTKRREREKALDKALEDSFPASDPISPSAPAPTRE